MRGILSYFSYDAANPYPERNTNKATQILQASADVLIRWMDLYKRISSNIPLEIKNRWCHRRSSNAMPLRALDSARLRLSRYGED